MRELVRYERLKVERNERDTHREREREKVERAERDTLTDEREMRELVRYAYCLERDERDTHCRKRERETDERE